MDRDAANREIMRLLEQYRSLPYSELLAMTDRDAIETDIAAPDGLVTFYVDVRRASPDSVRLNVSAFGNNWWKCERIDESLVVSRPDSSG